MKHNGIIALVFVVGCATGGVAAQLVVPPVRAGTSPTRWEYQCAVIQPKGEAAAVTSALNAAGEKGWELASLVPAHADSEIFGNYGVDAYTLCVKRALS